ncbi:MAG TPA: Sec-independent protein translocase protein TatB, partial [Casimicrobiaceae bacterium]
MFDVGFSEIVVIGVVALIVIGPERLPKAARTMGLLFGRLQRYVTDVKADISREMELDELRKLQKQVQGAAQEFKTSVESAAQNVHEGVRSVEEQLNATAAETTPSDAHGSPPPDVASRGNESGATLSAAAADAV